MNNLKENIERVIKENKSTINKALIESGAGKNLISNINQGQSPSIDKIIKLADYLEVSIDYLLGRSEQPTTQINNGTINGQQNQNCNVNNNSEITGIEKEFLNKIKNMSDTQKAELFLTACKMAEKE